MKSLEEFEMLQKQLEASQKRNDDLESTIYQKDIVSVYI